MLKLNINNKNLVLSFLVLVLLFSNNFFYNFLNIYSNDFENRINNTYGFCKNESVGYLRYLKKNFKLHNNPKIINYIHTPSVEWVIFEPKNINKNSNDIILLNYPGKIVQLDHERESHNILKINNLSFYENKINKIDTIIILFDKTINNDEVEIDLFSEIKYGKRNFIKKFYKMKKNTKNEIKFEINLIISEIYPKNNNISFKIKNLNNNLISEIKILAENKYIVENFNLVNNHQNCFLIKKLKKYLK